MQSGEGGVVVFAAFGTVGDVMPLVAVAKNLEVLHDVAFVTNAAHQQFISSMLKREAFLVSTKPVGTVGDKEKHRCECVRVAKAIVAVGLTVKSVVFNLFALEWFHLGEVLGVTTDALFAVSPCLIPYAAPPQIWSEFREAQPNLYTALVHAGHASDSIEHADVEHWMWPLFSADFGDWRENSLGLGRCVLCDPVTDEPLLPLPPSPTLLYAISPHLIGSQFSLWPRRVHAHGSVHISAKLHDHYQSTCTDSSSTEVITFLENASSHCQTIYVGFGSGMSQIISESAAVDLVAALVTGFTRVLQPSPLSKVAFLLHTCGNSALGIAWAAWWEAQHSLGLAVQVLVWPQPTSCRQVHNTTHSLPHDVIFPKCSCVVHHGGSGTTHTAARFGTPQIVWPRLFDQFEWAEKVVRLGLGAALPSSLSCDSLVLDACRTALSVEVASACQKMAACMQTENGDISIADCISSVLNKR